MTATQPKQYAPDHLCLRRQFVLGPYTVERFGDWKRVQIRPNLCATVHPDLGACQVNDNERSVTLLGFILSPGKPEATDFHIISGLLKDLQLNDNLDDFLEATNSFG